VFHQIFESFIDLWPKLDFLSVLEYRRLCDVQRELAELIDQGRQFQSLPAFDKAARLRIRDFRLFFGLLSLLLAFEVANLYSRGNAPHSTPGPSEAKREKTFYKTDSNKVASPRRSTKQQREMSTGPKKEKYRNECNATPH
jgi:hypothetical protein